MGTLFLLGGDDWDIDARLDDWWLGLAGSRPTVCLIPTASSDASPEIDAFIRTFRSRCHEIRILRLIEQQTQDMDALLMGVDLIYIAGGNTVFMLGIWQVNGVDQVLRQAWRNGTVIGGSSAGALCLGSGGTTDSFGDMRVITNTLRLIPESISPHYQNPERRSLHEAAVARGSLPLGYGLEDGDGVLIEEGKAAQFVSDRSHARSWAISTSGSSEIIPDQI
jgi:peptidase E